MQARTTKRRFKTEGSKSSHGKDNRVLHPDPLSEEGGMGSAAKARASDRVLLASKEVSVAGVVVGEIVPYLAEAAHAMSLHQFAALKSRWTCFTSWSAA